MNQRIEQGKRELSKRLAPVIAYYQSRDSREQRIIQVLGVVIAAAILYWLIWLPSWHARETARQRYVTNQQTLAWIRDNAPAVRAAHGQKSRSGGGELGADWFGGISHSAQTYGLTLQGFTPNGDNAVRIQMENQPAAPMLLWLQYLQKQGVTISTLEMSAGDDSGTANLHAMLSR